MTKDEDYEVIYVMCVKLAEIWPGHALFFHRFAVATPEELAVNNDDCAICWDSMQAARKLPCGHLFHK